jgi:hypothetical protein
MNISNFLKNQKIRYIIDNKYDKIIINNIFDRLEAIKGHFNDWMPNEDEFDNFIKFDIIPVMKYLGQDMNYQLRKLQKNKSNLTNDEIKRHNYLVKLKRYKMAHNFDFPTLKKHMKNLCL